jgi:hypothetical protein
MKWFIRMARWARHPPSPERVKLVFAVIVVCGLIYGIEQIWGWPDWLTPNSTGKVRLP